MADTVFEDFLAENADFRDLSTPLAKAARQIYVEQFEGDVSRGKIDYRTAIDRTATLAREHMQHSGNVERLRRMRGYHSPEISKLPPRHNPLATRRR